MRTICIKRKNDDTRNFPQIGIFWLIVKEKKEILVCFKQSLLTSGRVDIYFDSCFTHIHGWQTIGQILPELKNVPYEKYPRGRITFVSKDNLRRGTFKLMADRKILARRKLIEKIKEIYTLKLPYKVELLLDLHYRSK